MEVVTHMMASNTKVSNRYAFNLLETLRKQDYRTQEVILNIRTQLQPKSTWNKGHKYTMFSAAKTASEVGLRNSYGCHCTAQQSLAAFNYTSIIIMYSCVCICMAGEGKTRGQTVKHWNDLTKKSALPKKHVGFVSVVFRFVCWNML